MENLLTAVISTRILAFFFVILRKLFFFFFSYLDPKKQPDVAERRVRIFMVTVVRQSVVQG